MRNPYLQKVLAKKGRDDEDTWTSITVSKGWVQHLDFLTEQEKAVFKTAFELDQRWVIEHAADRTPFICQSQSVNIFLPANVHKRDLHQIHMMAWKRGVKIALLLPLAVASSAPTSVVGRGDRRAASATEAWRLPTRQTAPNAAARRLPPAAMAEQQTNDYEECLSLPVVR